MYVMSSSIISKLVTLVAGFCSAPALPSSPVLRTGHYNRGSVKNACGKRSSQLSPAILSAIFGGLLIFMAGT